MSMTLRLTQEQNAALSAYAARHKVSKNEAVLRALDQAIDRDAGESEVRRLTRQVTDEDGPLLDRLAQ